MVFQTPEYRQHSLEFQQICRKLQTSAEARNVDGAALAYVQLTMSCVNCHKYTRGIRMASLR
jgi:cytochrome c556